MTENRADALAAEDHRDAAQPGGHHAEGLGVEPIVPPVGVHGPAAGHDHCGGGGEGLEELSAGGLAGQREAEPAMGEHLPPENHGPPHRPQALFRAAGRLPIPRRGEG